jgi:outer membrane protein assembly factor BamD (BamD/ComL family)
MIEINHKNTMVLLIGASDFPEDPTITPIPNVKANIVHFKDILINPEIIGVPEANIMISLNETRSQIERKLLDLSKQTNSKKYTLLVYYSGHGILSSEDYELYLTTYQTSKKYLETDAVNINDFKRDIKRSAAGRKIVFLDCCHSGAIIGAMSSKESTIQAELTGFEGTYVMTSAAEDTPSLFPVENPDRPTYFTGKLLEVLNEGLESESEYCSLREIYHQIETDLTRAGLPRPQQSNINTADQIFFSRNKKYVKPRPADEVAWEETVKKNNKWAYKDFRRLFPESIFAEEARQRIIDIEEVECWKKTINRNTISSLDDYLETYPNGKYVNEANQRLIELRKKEEEEEEDRNWEQVVQAGDLAAFERYLEEYPNSKYAQKCQAQIKRLREEEKKKYQEEKALQKILARHIQQLEQKADKLQKQGHIEAALQLYYQVLEIKPEQQHSRQAVNQWLQAIQKAAEEQKELEQKAASGQEAEKNVVAAGLTREQEAPLKGVKWIDQLKAICLAVYAHLVKLFSIPAGPPVVTRTQEKEAQIPQEVLPDFAEVAEEVSPDVDAGSPDREEIFPDAADEPSPAVEEVIADVAEVYPVGEEVFPEVADEVSPDGEEAFPAVRDKVSPDGEKISSYKEQVSLDEEEAIPDGEEIFPDVEEVSPEMEEVYPAGEEIFPDVDEVSPYREKVYPDAEEIYPDAEEIYPDGEEFYPAGEKKGNYVNNLQTTFRELSQTFSLEYNRNKKVVLGYINKLQTTFGESLETFSAAYTRYKKVILGAAVLGLFALGLFFGKDYLLPDYNDLKPKASTPTGPALKPFSLLWADALYDQKKYPQSLILYVAGFPDLSAEQMRRIALIYEKGNLQNGLSPNLARSFSWYTKAAKSGNVPAMGRAGNFYYYGKGVVAIKRDSAFYWYLQSARNGDDTAMYNIGRMYHEGDGVKQNQDSAVAWFKKASRMGIKEADNYLH